jgi:hypothetical protein
MKVLAVVQLLATVALLAVVLVLGFLFGVGALPMRPAAAALPAADLPTATVGNKLREQVIQAKLVCLRGLKPNVEYALFVGENYIGRADEMSVDIDLDDQEPPDRVWSSRQHAKLIIEDGKFFIEDLNSANGTYVNRQRVPTGNKKPLQNGDVIQVGTVQLRLVE